MPLTSESLEALLVVVQKALDMVPPKEMPPPPPPTPFEWVELGILLFTGIAAFLAVLATFRIHRLSAGQVHVSMAPLAFAPFAGTNETRTNRECQMSLGEFKYTHMELAQIVIENPGRHGVTVTNVTLRVEGTKKAYYAVSPRNFSLERGAKSVEPDTYFRLEPFDRATVWFDIWSVVDNCFAEDDGLSTIQVWGEVTAAGHHKPFASTMKNPVRVGPTKWEFQRETLSFGPDPRSRRFQDLLVTELIRATTTHLNHVLYLDDIVLDAGTSLKEHGDGWTEKELGEAIGEARQLHAWTVPEGIMIPVSTVSGRVWRGIGKVSPENIDWGDIPRPALEQELDGDSPRALRPTGA